MAGALGFATCENISYVFTQGSAEAVPGASNLIGELTVLLARILMPIHVICSVLQAINLSKVFYFCFIAFFISFYCPFYSSFCCSFYSSFCCSFYSSFYCSFLLCVYNVQYLYPLVYFSQLNTYTHIYLYQFSYLKIK
jgi:PrsW family intramembrane metalloprotease